MTRRRLVLLLALALLPYLQALRGRFVYDDRDLILRNRALQRIAAGRGAGKALRDLLSDDFARAGRTPAAATELPPLGYYRPVVALSYALDAFFWGRADAAGWRSLNPVGFHLTNLLLHGTNTLLFYVLFCRLWPAAALPAALLFAVHPAHVENVAWISGRTDLLGSFFFLAAAVLYLAWRRRPTPAALAAAVGCFAAALLAKEMTATFPLFLLGGEVLAGGGRRRLAAVAPFLAVAAAVAWVRGRVLADAPAPTGWTGVGEGQVLATVPVAVWWYAGRIFFPHPPVIYGTLPFAGVGEGLAAAGGLAAALLLLAWLGRRAGTAAPLLAAGAFLAALLPVLNLLPGLRLLRFPEDVDFPVAERFLYLPSAAALVLVGGGWGRLRRRVGTAALTAGVTALAVLTVVRVPRWRTNEALYRAALATAPGSVRMHTNLGLELERTYRLEAAREHLQESIRLQEEVHRRAPDPMAYQGLGRLFFLLGEPELGVQAYARGWERAPRPRTGVNYAFALAALAAVRGAPAPLRRAGAILDAVLTRSPSARAARRLRAELRASGARAAGRLPPRARAALARLCAREGWWRAALVAAAAVSPRLFARLHGRARGEFARLAARFPGRPAVRFLRAEAARLEWEVEGRPEARAAAVRGLRRVLTARPHHLAAALALLRLEGAGVRALFRRALLAAAVRAVPLAHEEALWALGRLRAGAAGREGAALVPRLARELAAALRARAGRDARRWNDLGYVHFRCAAWGRREEELRAAAAAFRRALALEPDLVNAAANLVVTLERLGRRGEARRLRRSWAARFPGHPFFRSPR